MKLHYLDAIVKEYFFLHIQVLQIQDISIKLRKVYTFYTKSNLVQLCFFTLWPIVRSFGTI